MTVLVVDDERSVRRLFQATLEKMGVQVVCESNGYNALVQVHERAFDLIFMDIVMPGLNGVYAIQEIREIRPDARIAVMTGHADDEIIDKALAAGAETCYHKPITAPRLREIVATFQDGRGARRKKK